MATVPNYLPPPKALNIYLHLFSLGDSDVPPSLASVLTDLSANQYLIYGYLPTRLYMTALVYNPGTGQPEGYYDAYNVQVGDWMANDATGYTWKIIKLYDVTDAGGLNTSDSYFYAVMEDVDFYNAGIDPSGLGIGSPYAPTTSAVLFEVDEDGFPIFPPADTFGLAANFSGNVIGRFRALNVYNQYVSIYQPDVSGNFAIGDPLFIDGSGLFQNSAGIGDISGVAFTIGICTSIGKPTKDYFTFNPFGEYRVAEQTGLTGTAGTIFYINPAGSPPYTTTRPAHNPYPVYQLVDNSGNAILLKGIGYGTTSGGGGSGTGPTGPTGPVISYIFDGGNAASVYVLGPAFDCGTST